MAARAKGSAQLTMKRPSEPVTSGELETRLAPLLSRLGGLDWEDVSSIHITHGTIRLTMVPHTRGRRQLDTVLRVTHRVVFSEDGA